MIVAMSQPTATRELRGKAVFADPLVAELLAARTIGVLATIEPDGWVHAVPMWWAAGDGAIMLATGSRSRKVQNLERDARALLVLHDSRPGAEVCGTSLRGRVQVVRGAVAQPLIAQVHGRYVSERGLSLREVGEFLSSDDVALRFVPETATTWDERPTAASRALRETGGALPLEPTTPRE